MPKTVADSLLADPRVAQARKLLQEALADHQRGLSGPRPPIDDLKQAYAQSLQQLAELRGGPLYYPYLASGIGRGPLVELADGSVKYDMISGIGVHYLGHSHPLLLDSSIDAALNDTIMQGNLQQNEPSLDVCRRLVDFATQSGAPLKHAFLTTSGAMANENALKLVLCKKSPASRILAFEHTFAGRSFVLSQITDKPAYRAGLPTVINVDYIPFFNHNRPTESTQAAVDALKSHLARYPKQHAVMWLELVLGEGGYYAGNRDFFLAILDVLNAANVAVGFDEIQTFGRTTHPFAFQHFGLDRYADVATVGKLTQICATLFSDEFKPPPGLISQTFTGATASLLAARTILKLLKEGDFFGAEGGINRLRARFLNGLEQIATRHPGWITGPFGLGAMIAFTPCDGSETIVKRFLTTLFEHGVVAFIAGSNPYRTRFLMPTAAIADEDIDAVCRLIERSLEAVA
jgi:acetylornithine aminotransferase